jgi:colicin import membrane protein
MENQIEIINENQRDVELLEKKIKINLQKLFTPEGMDLIIKKIENEVANFEANIATKEGRAKIISMAAKIAKCKSPIKNLASELKEESRKLIDGVNSQWNRYEKAMDDLRDAVRKPVDEIEEREAKILKEKQDRLCEIEELKLLGFNNTSKEFKTLLENLEQLYNFDWQDFQFKVDAIYDQTKNLLQHKLDIALKYEAEQAELIQLKKEKAEREKKDEEERIAKEAEERAKKEAEESIKRAEQAKIDAENRARESERLAKEQAEKAELARIQAEKKAKEEAERLAIEAVEKERQRVAEIARKEAEENEKREANKRHRNKIEKKVLADIQLFVRMMTETESIGTLSQNDLISLIVQAVASGEIPNLTINY